MPQEGQAYIIFKFLFDYTVSIVGIILLVPVFIIISFLIKLSSPGPVFFMGIRTGKNGRPFKIYKFRTMVVGSDKGPGTTSKNDNRVTFIGKFLRKYKIDELPQLINILKGDMSFVGPRPELLKYTDKYNIEEKLILTVKPGITDLASIHFINLNEMVKDKNPDQYFEKNFLKKKNKLRLEYIKGRSVKMDIIIIYKTIFRLIKI
jgi:lipopolysaccharide/colanic/teichoic acid biosynthesis glycosyltransferase